MHKKGLTLITIVYHDRKKKVLELSISNYSCTLSIILASVVGGNAEQIT